MYCTVVPLALRNISVLCCAPVREQQPHRRPACTRACPQRGHIAVRDYNGFHCPELSEED